MYNPLNVVFRVMMCLLMGDVCPERTANLGAGVTWHQWLPGPRPATIRAEAGPCLAADVTGFADYSYNTNGLTTLSYCVLLIHRRHI